MNDPGILFHLATAMTAALVGAFIALRLRQSVIVGYLLAGHVIGPFTPGFVGHTGTVESLAEIGIVFLMFVVGVQLSFRELVRAGRVALLGAAMQVPLTIAGGFGSRGSPTSRFWRPCSSAPSSRTHRAPCS